MKIIAETESFYLREVLDTDIDGFFELDSDPEVHKYLGNKPVTSKDKSADMIHFIKQQYRDYGIGRWAIIDKQTNEFIGWTGLKYITEIINKHQNFYEIGYRLKRKYWGKGIATETALISLEYAFTKLKANEVYAAAHCENEGSNRILKKIGMNCVETFFYEDIKCYWYKIDKSEAASRYTPSFQNHSAIIY